MQIQWFPGHMANTTKMIKEQRGKVDVFLELLDARAPLSCRNPLLDELIGDMPRVIVLTKSDLADPQVTQAWAKRFGGRPATRVVQVSAPAKQNLGAIPATCIDLVKSLKPKKEGPVRGMIVGIPNVGKSTLINALARSKKASVAPKAGHTKGPQKITISEQFELVDTPGLLWHKFEDPIVAERLAMLGAIKDDIYDFHGICLLSLEFLADRYPATLAARYRLASVEEEAAALLEEIARKRGYLVKGGGIDIERTCTTLMNDLRGGALGRISLEKPEAD